MREQRCGVAMGVARPSVVTRRYHSYSYSYGCTIRGAMQTGDVRERAASVVRLLETYRALSASLVKGFFIHDHWSKLPPSWRPCLDALTMADLAQLLESAEPPRDAARSWPLSLRAFFAAVHALRLPGQLDRRGGATDAPGGASFVTSRGRCKEEQLLATALRESVKPKKMHEVVHLSALTDRVTRAAGCSQVVDVGSGLGYLSRTLAFEFGWPVVAVEGKEAYVAAASRIDSSVGQKMRKMRARAGAAAEHTAPAAGSLRHVAARLAPTTSADEFWRVLAEAKDPFAKEAVVATEATVATGAVEATAAMGAPSTSVRGEVIGAEAAAANADTERAEAAAGRTAAGNAVAAEAAAVVSDSEPLPIVGIERLPGSSAPLPSSGLPRMSHPLSSSSLVGLHTCGDLAPTMLRVFHHAGEAVGAIVSVGCCYMHVSECGCPLTGRGGTEQSGWPEGALSRDTLSPEGALLSRDTLSLRAAESPQEAEAAAPDAAASRIPPSAVASPDAPDASATSDAPIVPAAAPIAAHATSDAPIVPAAAPIAAHIAAPTAGAMATVEAAEAFGFPMSVHVRSLDVFMGYHLREHACHSLNAYAQRLRRCVGEGATSAEASLQLHGRRAILELLLARFSPGRQCANVGGLKNAAGLPFEAYVALCFQRLKLPPIPASVWDASLRAEVAPMLRQWNRVVVFYVMRLLLAPLWEVRNSTAARQPHAGHTPARAGAPPKHSPSHSYQRELEHRPSIALRIHISRGQGSTNPP